MILKLIAISLVITVLCLGDSHNKSDSDTGAKRERPTAAGSEPAAKEQTVVLDSKEDLDVVREFDSDLDKLHQLLGKGNQQASSIGEQELAEAHTP